jgi:hypothetical protein
VPPIQTFAAASNCTLATPSSTSTILNRTESAATIARLRTIAKFLCPATAPPAVFCC